MKEKPSICFGGITHGFVHAIKTENFLNGKCLNDPKTLDGALKTLSEELNPHPDLLEAEPIYRKNLALGLLYKTILEIGRIIFKFKISPLDRHYLCVS